MKKRKVLLILIVILLGVWFIFSVKELHFLMKKYPTAFHQSEGFSFTQFYNTYDTLSFSEVMIKKGRTSSYHCTYSSLTTREKDKLAPLITYEYYKNTGVDFNKDEVSKITQFKNLGTNCLSKAKLIAFRIIDDQAYATFSCEKESFIKEFTYTSGNDGTCDVIEYKKEWGIKPKRTQFVLSY